MASKSRSTLLVKKIFLKAQKGLFYFKKIKKWLTIKQKYVIIYADKNKDNKIPKEKKL